LALICLIIIVGTHIGKIVDMCIIIILPLCFFVVMANESKPPISLTFYGFH
jgi:hypothetical protein